MKTLPHLVGQNLRSARVVRAVALAVLALGSVGCQLRVGVDVMVRESGAGELAVTVGADEELLAQARRSGVDPLGSLVQQRRQLADAGWRVTDETGDDGSRQVRLSSGFKDADEFNALAADLAEALAAPEVRLLEPFTLQLTDDRIVLNGAGGLVPTPAATTLGISPEEAVRVITEGDVVAYEVRIHLPGGVLDTTAAQADRGVLIWRVQPGERVTIRAVGVRPGPSLLARVIAGVTVLVGGAVAALALARRVRRTAPDTRQTGTG